MLRISWIQNVSIARSPLGTCKYCIFAFGFETPNQILESIKEVEDLVLLISMCATGVLQLDSLRHPISSRGAVL